MNCIILSDRTGSIILEEFIGKTTALGLVGTFNDSESVKDLLTKRNDIDLAFIDLDILKVDIVDLVSSFSYQPGIIIISASDENAMKAFDLNVIDYLLKPLSYSRFYKAIDKATRYYSHKQAANSVDNEIFIKRGSLLVKLKIKDIVYVEALENYVTLYTNNERYTIHFTLKGIESQLPSGLFLRVHRSYIVNKSLIHAIRENTLDLTIGENYKNIPVGKSYRDLLFNDINLMGR